MQSSDNIRFTCWLDVSLNAFPKLLFAWSERACRKSPNFYEAPHLFTTPSLSATCHAKLQTLPHPIMYSAADYGSWFSPKMPSSFCSWVCLRSYHVLTTNEPNRTRVHLKVCREHPLKEMSLFGLLLVCTRVRLMHYHRPKRTAPSLVRFNRAK